MARDVLLMQEQWTDVMNKAWVRNQGNRTTQNTWSGREHHEILRKTEATCEDAFTISLSDTKNTSSSKEKPESSNAT